MLFSIRRAWANEDPASHESSLEGSLLFSTSRSEPRVVGGLWEGGRGDLGGSWGDLGGILGGSWGWGSWGFLGGVFLRKLSAGVSIVELSSQPVALKCAVKTHLLQDAHAPGLRLDFAGYCSWWCHHIMSQCGTSYSILTSSSVGYRGAFLLAGTLRESLQDLVLSGPCQTPVSSTVLLAKLGYSLEPANRLRYRLGDRAPTLLVSSH